jgi:hypothetical protein
MAIKQQVLIDLAFEGYALLGHSDWTESHWKDCQMVEQHHCLRRHPIGGEACSGKLVYRAYTDADRRYRAVAICSVCSHVSEF